MSKVLLVEDEPQIRQVLADWMARNGHHVVAVGTVDDANEELRKVDALESPAIDIVILDLALGNGRGKFRGLEVLKNISPAIVCVVLSGFSPADVKEEVEAANPLLGATFYFQKPLLTHDQSDAPTRDDYADLLHIVAVAGEKRRP